MKYLDFIGLSYFWNKIKPISFPVTLTSAGAVDSYSSALTYDGVLDELGKRDIFLDVTFGDTITKIPVVEDTGTVQGLIVFMGTIRLADGTLMDTVFLLDANDNLTNLITTRENALLKTADVATWATSNFHYPTTKGVWDTFQRKPVTVWEVANVSQGLLALNTGISSNLAWQLTNLDLSPYKRIKIYAKAGRKTGSVSADSSIVPAFVLEMLLDDRAKETVTQNVFLGSALVQNPNDANRLGTLTCAVSADKTKFAVLRQTSIYGTAATSNTDTYEYVFKIEGYYD